MKEISFEEVIKIVKHAARLFADEAAVRNMKLKMKADFVTEVDTAVQAEITEALQKLYPEVQLLGEEKDNSEIDFEKPVWILDPVDGTMNLVHHYRGSSISLAYAQGGEILAGIVYNPYLDELFFAEKNKGAFLNGAPIHVTDAPTLEDSLVSMGTNTKHRELADQTFRQFKEIFLRCHDLRRIGSAAIDLCYVACGRAEAYVEGELFPWDYAASVRIVEEAGGKVTTFSGETPALDRAQSILATNGHIHEEIRELLK